MLHILHLVNSCYETQLTYILDKHWQYPFNMFNKVKSLPQTDWMAALIGIALVALIIQTFFVGKVIGKALE